MSTLKTNTIQHLTSGFNNVVQFVDGAGTQNGTLCRAWVNFNGTSTVAIRASFNVSSITDNGTGDYTVNFTNAMSDANYACIQSTGQRQTAALDYGFSGGYNSTTTSTRIITWGVASSAVDWQGVQIAIFR